MKSRLIGVIHLPPLPGSPQHARSMTAITDAAKRDADALLEAGFDGFVVENFGDTPFFPDTVEPVTIAAMTRVTLALPRGACLGINVLRNDALGALAIAAVCDADFFRVNVHVGAAVTDQGIVTGRAAQTLRERARLGVDVRLAADVDVKHAAPLSPSRFSVSEAAQETAYRGGADVLIVSGSGTGRPTRPEDIAAVKKAVPDRPVWVGSGATHHSVHQLLALADGVIVGTAVKVGQVTTNAVDVQRAKEFVLAAQRET